MILIICWTVQQTPTGLQIVVSCRCWWSSSSSSQTAIAVQSVDNKNTTFGKWRSRVTNVTNSGSYREDLGSIKGLCLIRYTIVCEPVITVPPTTTPTRRVWWPTRYSWLFYKSGCIIDSATQSSVVFGGRKRSTQELRVHYRKKQEQVTGLIYKE